MNSEQRQKIERQVVRHLIQTLKAKGWEISRIDDGGDLDEDTLNPNEEQAMEAVFAVDDCIIYFHKSFPLARPRGVTHFVQIILGNDGYDCIADNSCGKYHDQDDFAAILDEIQEWADKFDEDIPT